MNATPERWEAVLYLLPGGGDDTDDRKTIVQVFDTPEEAMRWAASAVVCAHAESKDDPIRATYYPAHRMSHAVVRKVDEA